MRLSQVAWAAGIYEGEGTLVLTGRAPLMAVGMTDEDVVRRFAQIVGVGHFTTSKRKGNRKLIYLWRATSWGDVEHVINLVLPWLGERRAARVEEVLAGKPTDLCLANPDKTHCPRGHEYDVVRPNGWRRCRTCDREIARRARRRRARV